MEVHRVPLIDVPCIGSWEKKGQKEKKKAKISMFI